MELVHDPLVDQGRLRVGLFERLPDSDDEAIAPHALVGVSGGVNEDHGAERLRLGPEWPQRIAELDPIDVR